MVAVAVAIPNRERTDQECHVKHRTPACGSDFHTKQLPSIRRGDECACASRTRSKKMQVKSECMSLHYSMQRHNTSTLASASKSAGSATSSRFEMGESLMFESVE